MYTRNRLQWFGGLFLFFVMLGAWATLTIGPSLPAFSAEEGGEAAAAPAEEPAPAEAQPAKKPEEKHQKSYLMWIIESSGLIGLVIFFLSMYFVYLVSRSFWELRIQMAVPPEILSECENLLEQREFKGIYELVKSDDSFFSRVLTTGIVDLPNGLPEARESMERVGDAITSELERKISVMAVLGTLGPMIGLLGTLKGMIASFSVIALSDVQLKASEVAGGISEALLLTFEGVGLSVPAIYFFSFFKNRVTGMSTAAMLESDQFIRHFAHAGRSAKPAGAPAGAPARP